MGRAREPRTRPLSASLEGVSGGRLGVNDAPESARAPDKHWQRVRQLGTCVSSLALPQLTFRRRALLAGEDVSISKTLGVMESVRVRTHDA